MVNILSIVRYVWTMIHTYLKSDDFEVAGKDHGKLSKNSKMWMKIICKHRNNSPSNWMLVNNMFSIGYERWERLRRLVDGYPVSWTIGKWKSAKIFYMWHFASSVRKKVIFVSYNYKGWKVDLFWESQVQKIMVRPKRTINIYCKTESVWQKDNVLCLVGSDGRGLL